MVIFQLLNLPFPSFHLPHSSHNTPLIFLSPYYTLALVSSFLSQCFLFVIPSLVLLLFNSSILQGFSKSLLQVLCCAVLSCFSRVWLFATHESTRLLCPQDSPGNNTGVGCHALLQGIVPTLESNPYLLHCRHVVYHWATGEATLSSYYSP